MGRKIDVKDLTKKLLSCLRPTEDRREELEIIHRSKDYLEGYNDGIERALWLVRSAPSCKHDEEHTGVWRYCGNNENPLASYFVCCECGYTREHMPNYCPNCGYRNTWKTEW